MENKKGSIKKADYTADQVEAIEQYKAEHEAVITLVLASRVYMDGGY